MNDSFSEIHKWLKSKPYQTELGENGEYLMYFDIDMPKIINDFKSDFKEIIISILNQERVEVMRKLHSI